MIGLAFVALGGWHFTDHTSPMMLLISALSGVSTAAFVVTWLLSVRGSAYMLVEVFLMGGVTVPLLLSAIFWGEEISILQMLGLLLLLASVWCITTQKAEGGRFSLRGFPLLILCAVCYGISDFSQKLYVNEIECVDVSLFNLYTYVFAALALGICSLIAHRSGRGREEKAPLAAVRSVFIYVLIMALCLFLNSFFKTLAAQSLDAVLLYPLNQGCAVLLSLAMSTFLFGERMKLKGIVGVVLSIGAMVLINVIG